MDNRINHFLLETIQPIEPMEVELDFRWVLHVIQISYNTLSNN